MKCCEVFFENLNVPALCIQSHPVMALYGSGFTTGVAVDLGYNDSGAYPVYEGGLMNFARMTTHLGGEEVNNYIENSLRKRCVNMGDNPAKVVSDIKHALRICETPAIVCAKRKYKLPSGELIDVSPECFNTAELVFDPEMVTEGSTNVLALHEAVITAVKKCDAELHSELFNAIVPFGGLTLIPGLIKRLKYELDTAVEHPVTVVESPETYCVAWLGAAVFSGMCDAKTFWVTRKQYEDYGEKIVRNKFK